MPPPDVVIFPTVPLPFIKLKCVTEPVALPAEEKCGLVLVILGEKLKPVTELLGSAVIFPINM